MPGRGLGAVCVETVAVEDNKWNMVKEVTIRNYKSVYSAFLELGRINVFIGPNGAGKSNLLEAVAMFTAEQAGTIRVEDLIGKGVRIAKPDLTVGSFYGRQSSKTIEGSLKGDVAGKLYNKIYKLVCEDWENGYSDWINEYRNHPLMNIEHFIRNSVLLGGTLKDSLRDTSAGSVEGCRNSLNTFKSLERTFEIKENKRTPMSNYTEIARKHLSNFLVYSPATAALRGFTNESKKQPLGLYGEGLDLLIAAFGEEEQNRLMEYGCRYIDWLKHLLVKEDDQLVSDGHRLSRSNSALFFIDRLMLKKNSLLSVEHVDEGSLRLLFYLALFISSETPSFFAVENIDSGLSPHICSRLLKDLTDLSVLTDKQALITTHNPALLDGLDMENPENALFYVCRAEDGQTEVKKLHFTQQELITSSLSARWISGEFD